MVRRLTLLLAVMAILIAACGGQDTDLATTDPTAVIEAWETTWNNQDLDGYMALYHEDAVETAGGHTYEGKKAIRVFYEGWKGRFTQDCTNHQVSDDTVTFECVLTGTPGPVTGEKIEAVIVDGKIISMAVIGRFQP